MPRWSSILDDGDVELTRQQHDRDCREQRGDAPDPRVGPRLDDLGDPGVVCTVWVRSAMPPFILQTTNAPTARNAASFTIDSTAIARIRPF